MADFSQLPTLTHSGARRLLRRLELEAYASVVSAFRAQGQLSREKKASLELVAKGLGISAERHRAEIRRAVNDEVLGQVASSISGVETEKAWRHEGKKLLSSLPPRLVSHQHPSFLPQTLTAITTATHKLKASLGTNNIATEARKVPNPIQNALRVILSHVPLKSEQPPSASHSHPGSIKTVPPQKIPSGITQKSPQKNTVIKEELGGVITTHLSPSKASAEQGKVYSQLESLLCEEQLMLVKGGGRRGPGRLEISRLEGKEGGLKGESKKKDREERIGEKKDELSVVGVSDGGGGVDASSGDAGVSNGGGSGEDNMVVSKGGAGGSGRGERDGGKPLPTLIVSETRKRQLSPVPPRDLPPTKKQLPLSDSSSGQDDTPMSQTVLPTAEGQLINKATLIATMSPPVSMTIPFVLTPDETIPSVGKSACTVEIVTPTKDQATTSGTIPSTTQGQDTPALEPMDTCRQTIETPTVTNPTISSVITVMSSRKATCFPVEKTIPIPISVAPSFLHPHPHISTPSSPHSSSNILPATTKPQHLLPTATSQLQQLLPAIPSQLQQLLPEIPSQLQQLLPEIPSQLQQLLPMTQPLHATSPIPQHLPTTTPELQQVLPLPQPQKTLPETPTYQLPSVEPPQLLPCIILQPLLPSTSSEQLFPSAPTPFMPLESSLLTPAKEEIEVFHAKVASSAEVEASPGTLIINDLIQDTSDSAVSSLASQLGLENAPLLNLDFMSFFQPSTEGSDSMSAFTLPPLNVDSPAVPGTCSHLDVIANSPKLPQPPLFTTQFDTADLGSCPSSIGDPLPTQSDYLSVCHPSTAETKLSSPLNKVKPTPLTDGTMLTADGTMPSTSGKPADLMPSSSVEYLDLTDISSLMGNTDASKLLEGIPEDMAKSIQTIVQLDEQTWN